MGGFSYKPLTASADDAPTHQERRQRSQHKRSNKNHNELWRNRPLIGLSGGNRLGPLLRRATLGMHQKPMRVDAVRRARYQREQIPALNHR